MESSPMTADEAFRTADSGCHVRACRAKTLYVIDTGDYLYPSCGGHLTRGIRESCFEYDPPRESVTVFWRA